MSFICIGCGRGRAGTPSWSDGQPVCAACRQQQLGSAAVLLGLLHEDRPTLGWLVELEELLDKAANPPGADGSIDERRWTELKAVAVAAREYRRVLDEALKT